jgi:DNA primase
MRIDHGIITRVQRANDIVEIISEHVNLVRKGREMAGLCPFHDDHKPSMYVNPDKQIFKCFACGAGGDVIKFVQMREGLSFIRAVERLAERAGIKINFSRQPTDEKTSDVDPAVLEKVNRWALGHWQKNLADPAGGKICRDYIAQRQIPEKTAEDFSLGFAPDKWDDVLTAAKQKKIPESLLLSSGLIVKNEQGRLYDKFRNRLMFPIIDSSSRVIGFGGRTLGDDPAKYMNSPATAIFDKSNSVYALDKARHEIVSTGTAVIVEGYTDVIMAHRFECKNVVATLGTSLTTGHARLLRRFAKDIVLIFDSDIAGASAADRALEICLAEKIDIRLASVPQGKDPCDYLLAAGTEAFKKLIQNATDVMQYRWERLSEKLGKSDNLMDRRRATEDFLKTVSTAMSSGTVDAITQGLIINRLSRILQMRPEVIRKEIERRGASMGRVSINTVENQKVAKVATGADFGVKAQREIIEAVLNEPRLLETADRKVKANDFEDPILRQIWLLLAQTIKPGVEFSLADFLARIESTDVSDVVVELSDNGQDIETLRKRLNGAMNALAEYKEKKPTISASKTIDDERLRKITSIKTKPDRRNPGFMPI